MDEATPTIRDFAIIAHANNRARIKKLLPVKIGTDAVRACIANRVAFNIDRYEGKRANLFGRWEYTIHGVYYGVYSYGDHFPLAVYSDGKWYTHTDKYSRTTTSHMAVVLYALCNVEKMFLEDVGKLRHMIR